MISFCVWLDCKSFSGFSQLKKFEYIDVGGVLTHSEWNWDWEWVKSVNEVSEYASFYFFGHLEIYLELHQKSLDPCPNKERPCSRVWVSTWSAAPSCEERSSDRSGSASLVMLGRYEQRQNQVGGRYSQKLFKWSSATPTSDQRRPIIIRPSRRKVSRFYRPPVFTWYIPKLKSRVFLSLWFRQEPA
jgi:hypothetical protein